MPSEGPGHTSTIAFAIVALMGLMAAIRGISAHGATPLWIGALVIWGVCVAIFIVYTARRRR